jgi:hypothetical protein
MGSESFEAGSIRRTLPDIDRYLALAVCVHPAIGHLCTQGLHYRRPRLRYCFQMPSERPHVRLFSYHLRCDFRQQVGVFRALV